jgi:hydrogenase nickel incorporation protein HypA/HybF
LHELAVTQSILEIALRHAEGVKRITQLNLVIGDLSSVVDDSVQFYWDIISRGSVAEGARLHFERVRTRFQCNECGEGFEPDGRVYTCPHCGSLQVTLVAGREFRLESIEVE